MPELPDLQVFARNLNQLFKGKTLEQVEVPHDKKLNVSIKILKDALKGAKLQEVKRVGKELYFEFDNKHILGLHLMLHGEFRLFDGENKHKPTIIELYFEGTQSLAVTDFQGAVTPTLDPEEKDAPDALDVDEEYLAGKLSKTKTPVKTVLMDQKILRGIGNAYADEILWDAKISPFSPSNKLPHAVISKLVKSINKVLEDAEKQIIKSNPDLISGEVRDFLKVHVPRQKQTATGATIHQNELNSRKTYYTDEQELFD